MFWIGEIWGHKATIWEDLETGNQWIEDSKMSTSIAAR